MSNYLNMISGTKIKSKDILLLSKFDFKYQIKKQDLVFSVKLQFKENLCARQFTKPQVQNLCFISPKIIFIEVYFGSKKKLGSKKILVPRKSVWPKKNIASEKNLGPKKFFDGKRF